MKFLLQPPFLLRLFFPGIIWHYPRGEKVLYLSFDDGPDPTVTPMVLDLLNRYSAKATFFCIGKNVQTHPALYQRILDEGHRVGNHTWSHWDAWKVNLKEYVSDVDRAATVIQSELFRPPYGHFTLSLFWKLKKVCRFVLWDVITYDWDAGRSAEDVWKTVQNCTRSGSILVFHDSKKAEIRMLPVLERLLQTYSAMGYRFDVIR